MPCPPNLFDNLSRLDALLRLPARGLITDIDGTLSPIAPLPAMAKVSEKVKDCLRMLRPRFALVAAISGRPAAEAYRLLGVDGLVLLGNHGLEWLENNRLTYPEEVDGWARPMGPALAKVKERLNLVGLYFEDKGVSAAIHYRGAADQEAAREAILRAVAAEDAVRELRIDEGKMVVELRPPVPVDKGSAVRQLVERRRLASVIYLGDDLADVGAFRTIAHMRAERRLAGLSIVVAGRDTPQAAVEAADLCVQSPVEVEEFLSWLCRRVNPLAEDPRTGGRATS